MARKDISTLWDRDMRTAIDENFKELYSEYTQAGLDAKEARNKALEAVSTSDLAKQLAEQANLTSDQVRNEMNNIIREQTSGGDVVPEVVSARGESATLGERLNSTDQQLAEKATVYRETKTYRIPTNYPDLQTAIDELSEIKKKNLVNIELIIESGHQLYSGVQVENGDFSNFTISSEDPLVRLSDSFEGVPNTIEGNNLEITSFLFFGSNARLPILNCLVDMRGLGSAGYYATNSSNGFITPGSGVINAPFVGIEARASTITAEGTIADGCFYGYRAQQTGSIFAQKGKADNCESEGVLASRGSLIQFANGSAKNAGAYGARAQRSRIICIYADFTGSRTAIYANEASSISANNAIGENCANNAITASRGSSVDASNFKGGGSSGGIRAREASNVSAYNANFDNCTATAVQADTSSIIDLAGASAKNCSTTAILATGASTINASEVDCSNPSSYGVRATDGSTVNFSGGICTDASNAGLFAITNSRINGHNSDVRRSKNSAGSVVSQSGSTINAVNCNASENGIGFSVFAGGIISASGSTGEFVIEPNIITGRGIIFEGN